MVDTLTDNRNRTVAAIRNAFTRAGGALGEANSVAWMFNQQGVISLEAGKRDPEELALELLDAVDVGGDGDVSVDGDEVVVTVAPSRFEAVRRQLEERSYPVDSAEVTMNPTTSVVLDTSQARQVLRLLDGLEEQDDVQQVYANAEMPDSVLDAVS
jgi:transcriptional/translational regulatory protein YebC/TACO1